MVHLDSYDDDITKSTEWFQSLLLILIMDVMIILKQIMKFRARDI